MILWRLKKFENFYDQTIREKLKKIIFFKLYRSNILITQNLMLIPMQKNLMISTIIFEIDISNLLKVMVTVTVFCILFFLVQNGWGP